MTALGVDCSAGRPSGAALAAKGVKWSFRYIRQGSAGKLLTLAEYEDLTAHGIAVLGVSELGVHDMETGRSPGQQAAQADQAWLKAQGIPLRQWACAADEHLAAGGPIALAVQHAQGYADVLGEDGGVYGALELMTACAGDPMARVLWRWMWGHEPTAAQIAALALFAWQRNTGTAVIDGVTCDLNEIYHVPQEADVNLTDAVYTDPNKESRTVQEIFTFLDEVFRFGGPAGVGSAGLGITAALGAIETQLTAIQGALSSDQVTLLAAIKAVPAGGTPTDAQMAALASALEAALPTYTVQIQPKA